LLRGVHDLLEDALVGDIDPVQTLDLLAGLLDRAFFRLRLRANACLTLSFWPGFK
jgi:hypothetical protein